MSVTVSLELVAWRQGLGFQNIPCWWKMNLEHLGARPRGWEVRAVGKALIIWDLLLF